PRSRPTRTCATWSTRCWRRSARRLLPGLRSPRSPSAAEGSRVGKEKAPQVDLRRFACRAGASISRRSSALRPASFAVTRREGHGGAEARDGGGATLAFDRLVAEDACADVADGDPVGAEADGTLERRAEALVAPSERLLVEVEASRAGCRIEPEIG